MPLFAASRYSASGAIVATDDQIITGQEITVTSGAAITIATKQNVKVRKNRIHFKAGPGITTSGSCPGLEISDNEFIYHNAASELPQGPIANGLWYAIFLQAGSSGFSVLRNRITGGNGIFLDGLTSGTLQFFEHLDSRQGSFGASIGFQNSSGIAVSDFSIKNNLAVAWTGDNVNFFQASHDNTLDRGVIDGNNHPLGCAIIAEDGSYSNIFTDIDALRWGNGGFFAHGAGSNGNQFIRCRAKLNYWPPTQGRTHPSSAGSPPAFSQLSGAATTTFHLCKYGPLSGAASATYFEGSPTESDVTAEDFTPQTPYTWTPAYA